MKKKTAKIVFKSVLLLFILFFATACEENGEKELKMRYESLLASTKDSLFPVIHWDDYLAMNDDERSYTEKKSQNLVPETLVLQDVNLVKPYGLLATGKGLLIVDMEGDQLVLTDGQGKMLQKIGKTGNGEQEFLTPTGATFVHNHYYVIDQGNHRIQVLDETFRFVRSISLPIFEDEEDKKFLSIAVDKDETIYLAGNHITHAGLYRANKGDDVFSIMIPNFVGTVSSHNGHVFAINHGRVYVYPENFEMGYAGYTNYLWEIHGGKLECLREFPTKMQTNAFTIGEKIYLHSATREGVLAFERDEYEYQELIRVKDLSFYTSMALYKGNIYLSDPDHHRVLKLEGVE